MNKKLAVKAGKFISKTVKKLKLGSGVTLPGFVGKKLYKNILKDLSNDISGTKVCVLGTNGKTTTNSIIAYGMENIGKKSVFNKTGANMYNGITSAFLLNTDDNGSNLFDFASIEVDELASIKVIEEINPDYIILTNIARDQLDRFGEIDFVYNTLKEAFKKANKATLIINGDDPMSKALAIELGMKYITVGINEKVFNDKAKSEITEGEYCKLCGGKLVYDYHHYGSFGGYACERGDLKKELPDYKAYDIKKCGDNYIFTVKTVKFESKIKASYNIYNALEAIAFFMEIGVKTEKIKEIIENFNFQNEREAIFNISDGRVWLNLAKNPLGFQNKVALVCDDKEEKDVIIEINDTYQDGMDISWLWDTDFQYLNDGITKSIVVTGSRKYDMGLRLKYDEVPFKIGSTTKEEVEKLIKLGRKNIYVIVNYSGLYRTYNMLKNMEEENVLNKEKK